MALKHVQVFGRDCSKIVGYNEKTSEFVNSNEKTIINKIRMKKMVDMLAYKQIQKTNMFETILKVLLLSPEEYVSYFKKDFFKTMFLAQISPSPRF